jgi:hypothetical protein
VWAKVAQGLPATAGNRHCRGCRAELDYDDGARTLQLLQCDPQAPRWARGWRGKPVPVQTWYLAAAGKRSLRPGWACPQCQTEFDSDEALLKLVWTPAGTLSPLVNRTLSLPDWHRRAAGLPIAAEEKRLRDELARLEALHQQVNGRYQTAHQRRRAPLERELAQLCKASLLGGHMTIPPGTPRIVLRPKEKIRWQSAAARWRLRSAQGIPYWDPETPGTLVLTSERLLFDPAQGNLWQHPLAKLRVATQQRLKDTPGLVTEFHDLKNPIGFAPSDMTLNLTLGSQTYAVALTLQDLEQMLKATP